MKFSLQSVVLASVVGSTLAQTLGDRCIIRNGDQVARNKNEPDWRPFYQVYFADPQDPITDLELWDFSKPRDIINVGTQTVADIFTKILGTVNEKNFGQIVTAPASFTEWDVNPLPEGGYSLTATGVEPKEYWTIHPDGNVFADHALPEEQSHLQKFEIECL